MTNKIAALTKRFHEKYMPEPNSGCWLWMEGTYRDGYGQCFAGPALLGKKTSMPAHRVSWLLFRGPIPLGLMVCHKCDVPGCVNPDHLFLGTARDNIHDARAKGRMCIGEKNANSKLAPEDVLFIRTTQLSTADLVVRFGVSEETIRHARRGHTWAHLRAA